MTATAKGRVIILKWVLFSRRKCLNQCTFPPSHLTPLSLTLSNWEMCADMMATFETTPDPAKFRMRYWGAASYLQTGSEWEQLADWFDSIIINQQLVLCDPEPICCVSEYFSTQLHQLVYSVMGLGSLVFVILIIFSAVDHHLYREIIESFTSIQSLTSQWWWDSVWVSWISSFLGTSAHISSKDEPRYPYGCMRKSLIHLFFPPGVWKYRSKSLDIRLFVTLFWLLTILVKNQTTPPLPPLRWRPLGDRHRLRQLRHPLLLQSGRQRRHLPGQLLLRVLSSSHRSEAGGRRNHRPEEDGALPAAQIQTRRTHWWVDRLLGLGFIGPGERLTENTDDLEIPHSVVTPNISSFIGAFTLKCCMRKIITCLCVFMLVCYISVSEMFGLLLTLQASATAANPLCDQGTPFRSTLLWVYAPLCWSRTERHQSPLSSAAFL